MTISPASIDVVPAKARSPWPAALLAAALLLSAAPAPAEELGRLFFTPQQRAALERQRQLNIQETRQVIEGATLSVSGVVRRANGRTTAWVNGIPQEADDPAGGVRVRVDRNDPARATLIAGEETPATLRVGEAVDRTTGETTSGLGAGRISVKREGSRAK
jgi:hypothetical protein